jgi:hypothetical protein
MHLNLQKNALNMGIEPTFPTRNNIKKRHFDETLEDASIAAQSLEESITFCQLLIKLSLHLQGTLNNTRDMKIFLGSYSL